MRYLLCLLLLPTFAFGQKVTLPKEVVADSPLVIVRAETDCTVLKWVVIDPGISLIPPDLLKDSKTAILVTSKPGRFRVLAYGALKDNASEPAICTIVVGNAPPPGPDPPINKVAVPNVVGKRYEDAWAAIKELGLAVKTVGVLGNPVAAQEPVGGTLVAIGSTVTLTLGDPPSPAPIPVAGFRVLIIEERGDRGKLTAGQRAAILGKGVRDYLNEKCIKEGMQAAYWILDKDDDVSGLAEHWQSAWKRQRKSLPWLIVSNGSEGYEGPLPDKVEDTLTIFARYAPKGVR